MTHLPYRAGSLLVLGLMALGGCGTRGAVAPKTVDGVAYGVTHEPFHDRWWQYCERGVSWANGGFWAEAESDLRQCLALRRTDARRARTYGMHFVQCFAHRELGAVLIERGQLAEAESELELSMRQEPSAKTEFLLRRLRHLRDPGAAPAVVGAGAARPLVIDPAALRPAAAGAAGSEPAPAAPELTATQTRIVISAVSGEGDATTLTGRLDAPTGTPLWLIPAVGEPRPIAVDAQGSFTAQVAVGGSLASGGGAGADGSARPANLILTVEPPPPMPTLLLEGPPDGAQLQATPAWFRFRADAPQGLRSLAVLDADGSRRGGVELTGVRAGGMLAVALDAGSHDLRFVLLDAAGTPFEVHRRLNLVPAPLQHQAWRASALLVALQPSGMGQELRPRDPAYYEHSLLHAARFNLVAPEGQALLARELAWAPAGLVTPTTAVRAGREAQARYVMLGTVTRGRDDAECFVRLVNCTTGQVVATADAYDRAGDDFSTQVFFAALAGRLRQAFPVHQSRLLSHAGHQVLSLGTAEGVSESLRFHVLGDGRPLDDAGLIEVVACRAHDSDIRWLTAPAPTPAPALAVSE